MLAAAPTFVLLRYGAGPIAVVQQHTQGPSFLLLPEEVLEMRSALACATAATVTSVTQMRTDRQAINGGVIIAGRTELQKVPCMP